MEYKREYSFRKLIRSHKGGVAKPFKTTIIRNNYRVATIKNPSTTKTSNLISNLLSPLVSRKIQMFPLHQGIVVHPPERDTGRVDQ